MLKGFIMPKTEFTERDHKHLHKLAKETVEKFISKNMLEEWQSLRLIAEHVWEDRFYQAFHSTLREYFDWYDGEHQTCPYCEGQGKVGIVTGDTKECLVCQGRGWID